MDLLLNKELLIFDCDGVLFDSDNANIKYFNFCLNSLGYPALSGDILEKVKYLSLTQLIDEIFLNEKEKSNFYKYAKNVSYNPFLKDMTPLFDFEKIFKKLKQNYSIAMASNRGKSLESVLKHFNLSQFFDFTMSSIDAKPKPSPKMLLKIMQELNISLDKTIFLGDSISDEQAAKSAKVDFIWVGKMERPNSIKNIEKLIK